MAQFHEVLGGRTPHNIPYLHPIYNPDRNIHYLNRIQIIHSTELLPVNAPWFFWQLPAIRVFSQILCASPDGMRGT